MESSKLMENLFDKKTLDILKLFLTKQDQEFCLQEVAKYGKVPISSTYRIVNKLVELQIIERCKTKHLKTYRLLKNEKTKFLDSILEQKKTILDTFIEHVIHDQGINGIILYGKEEKEKANLLIIGSNVESNTIREAIVRIKEEHNYTITHLVLTEEQYTQMVAMNLYPERKEILFQR